MQEEKLLNSIEYNQYVTKNNEKKEKEINLSEPNGLKRFR